MSWSDDNRPKSARFRLLEAAWEAQARNMTPRQKLERMHLMERLRRLPIRKLASIWLDLSRGTPRPTED
jgi:hypothetical protein